MDSGQRRRATAFAAGLIGFALAIFVATRILGGDGNPTEAASVRSSSPVETPVPAETIEGVPRIERARDGVLNRRFDEIVGRWCREAGRRSMQKAHAGNVRVAVIARELAGGRILVARDENRALIPASNMKLVTTAAALALLGPGTEFNSPFEASAPITDGVLAGDLVVRASGDPLCEIDGSARIEDRLGVVARTLRALPLVEVRGDLVLDEGNFLEPGPGPAWPDASQHWTEYCARSGGFSANGGVLVAEVFPGRVGEAARVEVHPAPHGLRSRYGVTSIGGSKLDVRVGATVSTVTVRGEIPHSRRDWSAEFSHPDPVAHFGCVLRAQLEKAGIRIRGEVRRTRGVPAGTRLAELRSPVDDTLRPINTDSRNGVADQLFLALGHTLGGGGTRAGGQAATVRALEKLGVPTAGFRQVDGSGLSRDNRVSARQIAALLAAVLAQDGETPRAFLDSLAVAGRRGTLEDRMKGTPAEGRVFAKTGWINGASALSGFAETLDGRRIVFSVLVQYPSEAGGLNRTCFKPMQDEMVRVLVEENP